MMRLFVDVDDTLIHWKETDRYLEVAPSVCHSIVKFVQRWATYNPDDEIIIWSSGGKEYAERMIYEKIPELMVIVTRFQDKDSFRPSKDDLFIDDDPISIFREQNLHPALLRDL